MDLFARKVVGWAMASDIQATLVCQALQLACLTDKTRRVLFVAMNTVTGVVERAMGLSGGLTNTVFAGGIQGAFGLTFVIVQTIADRYRREICRVLVGGADAGLAQIWAGMTYRVGPRIE